jgi:dynein heavy chain
MRACSCTSHRSRAIAPPQIFTAILAGFIGNLKLPASAGANTLQAVTALIRPIVSSTVELFTAITAELLPTPAKSHYTFNLRDISKVFQGILTISPLAIQTADTVSRLWIHEAQRCFYDRLTNEKDRLWFTNKIVALMQRNFGVSANHKELFEEQTIMFADFLRPGTRRRTRAGLAAGGADDMRRRRQAV